MAFTNKVLWVVNYPDLSDFVLKAAYIEATRVRDALWARFFMEAPRRQRQSVERYNIVKRA
jgi:hypothetical protein